LTEAFIGLGSNVGVRLSYLRRAVAALRGFGSVRVSSVYETDPVGPSQPPFLNAVASLETSLSPRELLASLKRTEDDLGRIQRERWGPREIDLDLLLYGAETVDEPDLVVPHREMTRRGFVLVPLAELAPGARLPDGQILDGLLNDHDVASVRGFAAGDWPENQDDAQRSM
jgi:2-amino-4-hydroxy-6-hydroxymethyldihydropteridine diphosphokinase